METKIIPDTPVAYEKVCPHCGTKIRTELQLILKYAWNSDDTYEWICPVCTVQHTSMLCVPAVMFYDA